MKGKTDAGTIEEFVRLKPKMYSFLVDDIVSIKQGRI